MSVDQKTAREHYQAIKDLIGEEDLAYLKAFLDFAMENLDCNVDCELIDSEGNLRSEAVAQGVGLIMDILDPTEDLNTVAHA